MNLSFSQILKIIADGRNSVVFFVLTVISLSFSMAVILCNFGLMDGYEKILKDGLRKNSSDLEISSIDGFFQVNEDFISAIDQEKITRYTAIIRTEGFVIVDGKSKGILINGVEPEEFKKVSNLKLSMKQGTIAIGTELAKELKVGVGDDIVIAFIRGNQNFEDLPYMMRIEVGQIVKHGVYRKDLRVVYIEKSALSKFVNTTDRVNTVLISLDEGLDTKEIDNIRGNLEKKLPFGYKVKPYWKDFKTLLEAVKVEKFSITTILQLIIIIALFNIVAFINFNTIKKSQEFFLLRALGVSQKSLFSFWKKMVVLIWGLSCLLSLLFTFFFDMVILKLPFLKIPSQIYELDHLSLSLDIWQVGFIFLLTFIWSVGVIGFILWREKTKPLLAGLRQQFG